MSEVRFEPDEEEILEWVEKNIFNEKTFDRKSLPDALMAIGGDLGVEMSAGDMATAIAVVGKKKNFDLKSYPFS